MSEHTVVISDGRARFIYSDDLADLTALGPGTVVKRASNVEPAPYASGMRWIGTRGWVADMAPSGGPVLLAPDGDGFSTREAALQAERQWLVTERGL